MKVIFRKFAERMALAVGTPWAFIVAIAILVGWAASGPFFGFSENWQLVVNSFTTIVTFLMVFIIQNTQNRDFKIIQIQITELVRASPGAHRGLIYLENFSDEDLDRLEHAFRELGGKHDTTEIVRSLQSAPPSGQRTDGTAPPTVL